MLTSIDLFSGTAALTLALSGVARPVLYCDIDPAARNLIEARIASGHLPSARVTDDVTKLRGASVPRADLVVGGFPCVGFSARGKRKGLDHAGSALFYELVRVVAESHATAVFLENVPAVMQNIASIQSAFSAMGFSMRWCIVGANDAGAPHVRRRWFCLAFKPTASILQKAWRPASPHFSPFRWGPGAHVPPRTKAVAGPTSVREWTLRWNLLGNGAVPDAARLAFFRILSAGRVASLTSEPVQYIPVSEATDDELERACAGRAWSRASPASAVVHADPAGHAQRLPSVQMRPPIVHQQIVLDPCALPPPHVPSPLQKTLVVESVLRFPCWATPRRAAKHASRVLTARCAWDLPTQIAFERDTTNRGWRPNADFGDYLMGLPPGHTQVEIEANTRACVPAIGRAGTTSSSTLPPDTHRT